MLTTALAVSLAAVSCPPLGMDGLKRVIAGRDRTTIVFFASWCGSCKGNLEKSSSAEGVIAVAAFDEREAAELALTKLRIKIPCYLDDGLASAFGVQHVPVDLVVGSDSKVLERQ